MNPRKGERNPVQIDGMTNPSFFKKNCFLA